MTPAARAYAEALAGAAAKPRKPRPFRLTPERPRERPEQRAMVQRLNAVMVEGFCVHFVNEGLWSFIDQAIPNPKERGKVIGKLKQAMLKDGFLPRLPDNGLFWKFPKRWREILEAAGERLPQRMACVGLLEAKRPGWTPEGDKAWRESREQMLMNELLRKAGVPFAVARDSDEAVAAARAMGAPVRDGNGPGKNADGGDAQRSDVADPPDA